MVRVLGIDLAWGEGADGHRPNETGVVAASTDGVILDAGWTVGLDECIAWMERWAVDDTIAMVDAPLLVRNVTGQRACEREVGQRYGRWKVSANSSNLSMPALAGVRLLDRLRQQGWQPADARTGPPEHGRWLFEVYPYTTLVGAVEFGYDERRPVYKRRPKAMTPTEFRVARASNCDELVARLESLRSADPAMDITSHPASAALATEPSPLGDRASKHREDLIDAVLCAWTGLLWRRHGSERCQVLGAYDEGDPPPTIIAPARPEQRRRPPTP